MLSVSNFADRLCRAVEVMKSFLCAGLDFQLRYMPPHLIREAVSRHGRTHAAMCWLFSEFGRRIIDAVHDIVPVVKPNEAFCRAYGWEGIMAFEGIVDYARSMGLLVIGDAKRGDGGDTAEAYADGYLGEVPFFGDDDPTVLTRLSSPARVDCLTVNPYIGESCVMPFVNVVKQYGTAIFVVVRTTFKPPSAVELLITASGRPVWQEVAAMVGQWGEGTEGACGLRNVGVVMGANRPEEAVEMRKILPNSIFLAPGFAAQGGTAKDAVVGVRPDGFGVVVNNSRALTYAWCDPKGKYRCESEKFAEAARLKAIDDRETLVAACREAGKWPH